MELKHPGLEERGNSKNRKLTKHIRPQKFTKVTKFPVLFPKVTKLTNNC